MVAKSLWLAEAGERGGGGVWERRMAKVGFLWFNRGNCSLS